MGAGGLPPNSVDDYKLTVPEAWAAEITPEALAADPEFKGFLGRLHAAKLNQAQLDVVLGELIDRSMKLQDDIPQASADETTAALKADWKTDDEFQRNVSAAYKAGAAFGDIDALMAKYGNDPDFIRFAAKVGAELSEDTGTPGGSQQLAEPDVEALMKSPAYWNASDPQHANVKAKVAAHYAAVHGNKPRTTGSMAFSSAVG